MDANAIVQEDARFVADADLPWRRLHGKRVLVTGATGALGSLFVNALLAVSETAEYPVKVTGLARSIEKAKRRFPQHASNPNLSFIVGQVEDIELVNGYDYIFHAASNATPKYYSEDPVGTITANIIGTKRLLESARQWGSEGLVFVSSGEVYGQTIEVPTSEDQYGYLDPVSLRSCYAESKRAGESLCVAYNHQYGVPAFIVRPFHTYGPTMALDDGRVYADFVADVVAGRNITIKGDGRAQRAFCYVSDATAGFFTVMLRGKPALPYNVGDEDSEVSIRELAHLLAGLHPEKSLEVVFEERADDNLYMVSPVMRNAPDTTRLRSLGWQPSMSLRNGFQRTIKAFGGPG